MKASMLVRLHHIQCLQVKTADYAAHRADMGVSEAAREAQHYASLVSATREAGVPQTIGALQDRTAMFSALAERLENATQRLREAQDTYQAAAMALRIAEKRMERVDASVRQQKRERRDARWEALLQARM